MVTMFSAVATLVFLVGAWLGLAPVADADTWQMPDLIGEDLQGAQDAIQSLTDDQIWYTKSVDLTGQDRPQLMDRLWVVCSSTPPPGATLSAGANVSFGVVRLDLEECP